jgi:disulfide bond formation protein DsbB
MLAPSRDQSALTAPPFWRANAAVTAALIVALVSAATLAGAWFFELVLKYQPCPMCLEERWPYYIGAPLALVIALAAARKGPRAVIVGGLLLIAALMVWNTYMGAFHAGVEWKWWPGPAECTGAPNFGSAGGLLNRLQTINVPRCDEAALRIFGISLAGYNALISAALVIVALVGARAASRR